MQLKIRQTKSEIVEFRLADVLEARLATMKHRSKRARTRAALVAATAREMERSGADRLTVARIADLAGTAHGTFYLYFSSSADAAMAVRRLYAATVRLLRPRGSASGSAYEAIQKMNLYYVRNFAANAKLLKALQTFLVTRPDFSLQRDRTNHRWSIVIAHDARRRQHGAKRNVSQKLDIVAARCAIAMADELLREIYIHESPSLAYLRDKEDMLVKQLSIAWYRLIFGADP